MSNYDPKKVSLTVGANHTVTGFMDKMFTVEPVTKESMKFFVGVQGDVTGSVVHDDRHVIKFTLKAKSPSNIYLDLLQKTKQSFPVAVKNESAGKYVGGGLEAYISEKPTIDFPNEDPKREWAILVANFGGTPLPEKD